MIQTKKEERHNLAMYHIEIALDLGLLHIFEGAPITKQALEHFQNKFGEKRCDISESTLSQEGNISIVSKDNPTMKIPQWMMKNSRKKKKTSKLILLK